MKKYYIQMTNTTILTDKVEIKKEKFEELIQTLMFVGFKCTPHWYENNAEFEIVSTGEDLGYKLFSTYEFADYKKEE